ncbi:MAG: hypothetical protein ACRDY7_03490 [Acidimicrobiia bacterium]
MPVLVDYRCGGCGTVTERWAPSPPEPTQTCPGCGGDAVRRYGFSLGGRATAAPAAPALPGASCRGNPDVPLLCHVDPAAAPGWIARYRGDNRMLDEHLKRSEEHPVRDGAPLAGSHHSHGHHHHHHGLAAQSDGAARKGDGIEGSGSGNPVS